MPKDSWAAEFEILCHADSEAAEFWSSFTRRDHHASMGCGRIRHVPGRLGSYQWRLAEQQQKPHAKPESRNRF